MGVEIKGWGLGCRVQGSGFQGSGFGFRVQGSGFRVQGSGFRVQGVEGGGGVPGVLGPARRPPPASKVRDSGVGLPFITPPHVIINGAFVCASVVDIRTYVLHRCMRR